MSKQIQGLTSTIKSRSGGGVTSSAPSNPTEKPRGRPPGGKRNNPEYRQVSAWVRRDTYDSVAVKLIEKENRKEFSKLVQELLEEWLKVTVVK